MQYSHYGGGGPAVKQAFVPQSFLGALSAFLASLLIAPKLFGLCEDFLSGHLWENFNSDWAVWLGLWLFYVAAFPLTALCVYAAVVNLWRLLYLRVIARLI